MKKYIIIFLILLSASVSAQYTIDGYTYADTIHINTSTTFPYSATQNNTAYILTEDVTTALSSNGAIYFNNCDSCALKSEHGERNTINLSTDFAQDGDRFGVVVNSASYWFRMDSIVMLPTWNTTDTFSHTGTASNAAQMLHLNGCYRPAIYNSVIRVWGFAAGTDWNYGGVNAVRTSNGYLMDFDGDSIYNSSIGWDRRDTYPTTAMTIYTRFTHDSLTVGSRSDYTVRVANSYFEHSWAGILTYSQAGNAGVVVIDTNYFVPKAIQTSTTHGSYPHGDGAAITLQGQHKIFVDGNTCRPFVDSAASPPVRGGMGIFLSGIENDSLTASPRSEIANNDMYGILDTTSDHAYGLFTKWGLVGIDIHDNTFRARATGESNSIVNAAWIANHGDCNFYNNTYEVVTESDAIAASALNIRGCDVNVMDSNFFYDENLYSNDWHIYWYMDGSSAWADGVQGQDFRRFIFHRIDTASTVSGEGHLVFPTAGWNLYDNMLVDFATQDGISDTAISFPAQVKDNELDFWRNLQINAEDSYSNALNSEVIILNDYGDTLYNTTVGTDGLDTLLAKYWRETQDGLSDSVGFNSFIGTAVYSNDTIVDTFNIGAGDSVITFSFSGGTPPVKRVKTGSVILQGVR